MTTGAALAGRIRLAAHKRRVPVGQFLAPISANPIGWIKMLERASHPKPHTLARIEALLEGREPLPAPQQTYPARPAFHIAGAKVNRGRGPDTFPEPVTRDPCGRCGTRADLHADADHAWRP